MNYVIKLAEKEHLEILPSIEQAASGMFSVEDIPLALRSEARSQDEFEQALAKGYLWVAVDDLNIPVGFLMTSLVDGNCHIQEIDVHPDHGRKGLGAKLLNCVINKVAQEQFQWITLTTFEHLSWNAPFYCHHGFSIMEETSCGKELSAIIAKEKQIGLKNRVAMSRKM